MKVGERFRLLFEPNEALLEEMRRIHQPRIARQLVGERVLLIDRRTFTVPIAPDVERISSDMITSKIRGSYIRFGEGRQKGTLHTPPNELPIYAALGLKTMTLFADATTSSIFDQLPVMRTLRIHAQATDISHIDEATTKYLLPLDTSVELGDPELLEQLKERINRQQGHASYDEPPLGVIFKGLKPIN